MQTITEEAIENQLSMTDDSELLALPDHITTQEPSAVPQTRLGRLISRLGRPGLFDGLPQDAASLRPPSSISQEEKLEQALRVIARLRQPFGALLLALDIHNVAAYRRVAAESLITVRVEEITPAVLNKLVDSVRTLDVL